MPLRALPWKSVQVADRGRFKLDKRPIRGGQAEVFRAVDSLTGETVAFKRVLSTANRAGMRRLRREIRVQGSIDHPNIMPIIAVDADSEWYVMPWADGTLETLVDRVAEPAALEDMLHQVCAGLSAAHEHEHIHRDLTPRNILLLAKDSPRWVVADWGLVRPGKRTTSGARTLTRTGVEVGTEGFAAPELADDPHNAGPAADVFSLGQIVGWVRTGTWPRANMALLPELDDPYRPLVRAATELDVAHRLVDTTAFLDRLNDVTYEPAPSPMERALDLLGRATEDAAAAREIFQLFDDHRDDSELILDVAVQMDRDLVDELIIVDEGKGQRLVRAMGTHLNSDAWGRRDFNSANSRLRWLRDVARAATEAKLWDLLEISADVLLESEASWSRFESRRRTQHWLEELGGRPAQVVARALRRNPDAGKWLTEEGWHPRGARPEIVDALERRPRTGA